MFKVGDYKIIPVRNLQPGDVDSFNETVKLVEKLPNGMLVVTMMSGLLELHRNPEASVQIKIK